MTVPNTKFDKTDGQTGVVGATGEGILVIIAAAEKGDENLPGSYRRPDSLLSDHGDGPLTQIGAYVQDVAEEPVVVIRPIPSTPGSYGAITTTGGGTSAATAGATEPLDDFDVVIKFVKPGDVTIAGITYQISLDGGVSYQAILALGTSSSIVIANTGITIDLTNGTILQGETFAFSVKGPRLSNTDLSASLEALRVWKGTYEGILVSGLEADSNTTGIFEAWLTAREAEGKFKFFAVNTRRKNPGESEAAFFTAMAIVAASMSSIRGIVGTDGCDLVSVGGSIGVRGVAQPRDTAVVVAARAMAIDISEDPAYIARGALVGANINTLKGTPKYHDEQAYPGPDDLRLTALRNVEGEIGTFVDNARVISPANSDYVYLQHIRVMNKACAVAWQRLQKRLSKGVKKDLKTGLILETEARSIEEDVNGVLRRELKNRISGVAFILSRDDDLSSNQGAIVTGELQVDALAYIKGFAINAHFVKTLSVQV